MSSYNIGYTRVSIDKQDEALQLDALQKADTDRVFIDRVSGSTTERPGLTSALECARPGDSLVVWRLGRLGRSLRHLIDVVKDLDIRERTMAGLAAARARGRTGGRPTVWTQDKLTTARAMRASGDYDVSSIARVLGVSRASVYRALQLPTLDAGEAESA